MRKDIAEFATRFNDIPYERKSLMRILWGFKDLDYYTKGLEIGLNSIEADTNTGKSVLTSSVLKSACKQGYQCCVYASEHTNESYKALIMQQNGKKGEFITIPFVDTNGHETNIADFYVNESVEQAITNGIGKNITLFNSHKQQRDLNTILDWIEYCGKELNCKFCLIDNFMEVYIKDQDLFRGQEDAITLLRNKLLELNMVGLLVTHINKESASNGFRLTVKSARGTSTLGDKSYNLIALYRKDYIVVLKGQEKILDKFKQDCARCGFDYDACDGFIEVLKTKGNGSGIVGLIFDKETKTYEQAPKISKTDADKIYKRYEQKEYAQASLDWDKQSSNLDLQPIDDDEIKNIFGDDDLPF